MNEPKSIKSREEIYHLKINVGVFPNMGIKCILDTKEEKVLFKTELFYVRYLVAKFTNSLSTPANLSASNKICKGIYTIIWKRSMCRFTECLKY